MSWYGCYALDLYCDNSKALKDDKVHTYNEFPHQYTDEYGAACRAIARKAGWIVRKDGSALCPKCSGKKPAKSYTENRQPAP